MKFQHRLSEPQGRMLEGCLPEQPPSRAGNHWQRLTRGFSQKAFWAYVLKLATGPSGPVVEQRCDLNGQTVYSIYDPTTQQQSDGLSEAEARTWLEQRYYQ